MSQGRFKRSKKSHRRKKMTVKKLDVKHARTILPKINASIAEKQWARADAREGQNMPKDLRDSRLASVQSPGFR
jgi:hypothetical protein